MTRLRLPVALVATALIIGSYAVPTALAAPATQVFAATADAHVLKNSATSNFGSEGTLTADRAPGAESLLRFDVGALSGSVTSATLRFWVTSGTSDGPVVHAAPNSWTETGVTWATRPTTGAVVTDTGSVREGTWLGTRSRPRSPGMARTASGWCLSRATVSTSCPARAQAQPARSSS